MITKCDEQSTIMVGVSSCLMGEKVRYDGGHKQHSYITDTLGAYFTLRPFCPEVEIGLGVPRPTLRIVRLGDENRCVGATNPEHDVTEQLSQLADEQRSWHSDLCGYILKKGSPSCGMERVKVYRGDIPTMNGEGLYAKRLKENFPLLPLEEEGRLGDPGLRENFIRRVYVLHRWKTLLEQPLTAARLMSFHSQHKLIAMSHNQDASRELGRLVAGVEKESIQVCADQYIQLLMSTLSVIATRGNHVNVLQHIQGYLKRDLEPDDKAELTDAITQYRLGYLPLIVPITLLKHHFRKSPDPFIENSKYMQPYPQELCLLNTL